MQKTAAVENERGTLELTVETERFDDMETVELMEELQSGKPESIIKWPGFIRRIFGEDQKQKIYDFLRDPDGRVPIARVTEFVTKAIAEFGKKN